MSKLKKLISNVRRDNKLSADELLNLIVSYVESEDEELEKDIYRDVYTKSYGEILTRDVAEDWVKSLKVTDGSGREDGMKWNIDATTEVGKSVEVDWSKISKTDWFVAMNMEYARHYHTAAVYGVEDDPAWFAHIAKDEWCSGGKTIFEYYMSNVI